MKTTVQTIFAVVVIATAGATGLRMLSHAQQSKQHESADPKDQAVRGISQYQALATVTLQQALATAEAAQGSPATEAELDVEEGSLVYEVEFADGTEISIDAGNNTILKTERPGETTDAMRQGSIQIPDDIPAAL